MNPLRALPLVSLLALAVSASAQKLTATANASGGSVFDSHTASTGPVTATSTSSQQGSHHGESIADFGVLKTFGTSSVGGDTPTAYHFGSAIARFEDTLTFTNEATADTWGYVTFKWRVDGKLQAAGSYETAAGRYESNRAGGSMTLTLSGNGETRNQTLNGRGVTTATDGSGSAIDPWLGMGEQTTTVAVGFGQAVDLYFNLYAFAETTTRDGGSATADLGHSAYWGGIASVTDPSGKPLAYSVAGLSGHDWTLASQPVPEPASLAALGVGALGLLRRRRR